MGNVIELNTKRFSVGTKAWHTQYHVCYILESIGDQRKIKAIKRGSEAIIWEYASVHVNDLKKLDYP
ncbi:MAG: hypothetical protein ABI597_13275 [Gammaproteobacteria bacterium]